MPSLTLSVPKELKEKMDRFAWLNWSSIAREAFDKRMRQLEILKQFEEDFSESKLTDNDCIKFGRELKQAMSEKNKGEK